MWTELLALLTRYYISYFRVPRSVLNDFVLGFIIGLAIALRQSDALGILMTFIYLLTLPFTFITTVRTMLGEIVSEKSAGIKEYLKLNGLTTYTYQLYLVIITAGKTLFYTAFIVAGIVLGDYLVTKPEPPPEDVPLPSFQIELDTVDTSVLYALCGLGTISFTLFLSTLFSDPNVASSVGALAYAAVSLFSNIVLTSVKAKYYYLMCLFPQSALTLSLFTSLDDTREIPGFTQANVKLVMVFDIFLYYGLFWYLDQVIKDDNGVNKSPLFFLDFLKAKKKKKQEPIQSEQEEEQEDIPLLKDLIEGKDKEDPSYEDTSSAVYHEKLAGARNLKKAVEVHDLEKRFDGTNAVDKISFSIYEGQIFGLLGHNGAGKTTTIRMLSGFLEHDAGDILYEGNSLMENLQEIRTKIGICLQQDIYFQRLKVQEHLELIAKLRKVPPKDIPVAVDEAIHHLNLTEEREKFAEELSGGNKRKLSLAMAVIGKTKVVFLDEPTSGMDPQNRRVMWHHLKELRQHGLTVLLTTHHLDEADELADRIAIMSKGKLLALGTSEFFKKNFGVGYNLSLTPKYDKINLERFNSIRGSLKNTVLHIVPEAKFDDQTAQDVLKCLLPFAAQSEFPALFSQLEKNEEVRISVEMNSLEDVFVNIGMQEDKLLQGKDGHTDVDINVKPPDSLTEKPQYSFIFQTYAIARRRVYILIRSARNMFLMLLPLILILIGLASASGFEYPIMKFAFFLVVTIVSFALNSAVYCSLPVYEKEDRLKYLMDVMGLRILPYWLGNVIIDCIAITLINVIVYIIYADLFDDIEPIIFRYVNFPTPADFIKVLIPHGLSLVTVGYFWSFIFDKTLSAVKYYPLFYFFILFMFGTFFVTKAQKFPDPGAEFFLYTPPERPYAGAIVSLVCPTILYTEFIAGQRTGLSIGATVAFEYGYAIFYFLLTLLVNLITLRFWPEHTRQGWLPHEPENIPVDTDDVNNERARVLSHSALEDPIKVLDLVKIYENGFTAVRGTSFGVGQSQIFGLLGPNGAGKSTTFNIITAAIPKTRGSVQLENHEVVRNMPEVYEDVGVCPQFNGLWEHLTVREHLILFGNLKGLSGSRLNEVVEYYLDALHLREYQHKRADKLSGGNKRKLSVANAFIGSAYLIFLDEPSSGVDPLARRFLWNAIQQVLRMRQASVILTTHSMYEAESLSHKIGILINGRFVCIGPTQYLKDRYSQGYKITVALISEGQDPTESVMAQFPNASRSYDVSYVQQTYQVPAEGFKFSEAFGKLEGLKQEGVIKDFSIYNTTLEQIFIHFSKFQISLEDR